MPKHNELIVRFVKHFHVNDSACEENYLDSEIVINDKCYVVLGPYNADLDPADYFDGFVDGIKYLDKINKKKLEVLQIEYEHKADYEL